MHEDTPTAPLGSPLRGTVDWMRRSELLWMLGVFLVLGVLTAWIGMPKVGPAMRLGSGLVIGFFAFMFPYLNRMLDD